MATQFFWTQQLPEEYLHTCQVLDQQTQPHSLRSLPTPLFFKTPAIRSWDTLPDDVCKINLLSTFKRTVSKHWQVICCNLLCCAVFHVFDFYPLGLLDLY